MRSDIFDAELHAIYEGLLLLLTLTCMEQTTAYLCIDNQSAIQILSNNEHNYQFAHEALAIAQDLMKKGWNILTMWTPSYTNILSYPTCKPHFKNGDSYQVMTQA
jgi:hypothetical protein